VDAVTLEKAVVDKGDVANMAMSVLLVVAVLN